MENTFGHIGASCQQLNFIGVQKDKANVINVNILGNLSEGYTGLLCTIASFLWIWNYVKLKFVTLWVDKWNNGTTTQTRNLGLSLPTHHVPISKPIFSAILQVFQICYSVISTTVTVQLNDNPCLYHWNSPCLYTNFFISFQSLYQVIFSECKPNVTPALQLHSLQIFDGIFLIEKPYLQRLAPCSWFIFIMLPYSTLLLFFLPNCPTPFCLHTYHSFSPCHQLFVFIF